MIELREADRRRIFNLGYYTWVEQQGTPFELFEQRRHQSFWRGLRPLPRRVGRDDLRVQLAGGRQVIRPEVHGLRVMSGRDPPTSTARRRRWSCCST